MLAWGQVRYTPQAVETVAFMSQRGFVPFVVTNQSAVGRGLTSRRFVEAVHERIARDVLAAGGRIAGFAVCCHTPGDGCDCRKPRSGMLEEASRATGLPLSTAWMVGDADTDMEAGRGCGTERLIHVCSGRDRSVCGQRDVSCLEELQDLVTLASLRDPTQGRQKEGA